MWPHCVESRIAAQTIAGAKHLATGDAGARQGEAEHPAPVIASAQTIDSRRSAELADGDDECLVQKATLLQISAPSREDLPEYRDLRRTTERLTGHIIGRYGEADWMPLRYINRTHSRRTLAGYYRAARAGLVTPLRDGLNLVAEEFVAAQDAEDPGILVLSRWLGNFSVVTIVITWVAFSQINLHNHEVLLHGAKPLGIPVGIIVGWLVTSLLALTRHLLPSMVARGR